jgi:nucleotidyltransferase/DNA polymerase involved in DNA repair
VLVYVPSYGSLYVPIDLDAFFISVEQALNAELKGKPVIVGGDSEHRGLASNASAMSDV